MSVTGTSLFFDRGRDHMAALSSQADALQTQIATRKKLTTASQDSAAWQRLQGLAQAKADATAYSGNITTAQTVLAQTDDVLKSVQTQLQRAQELAITARTGTMSADNRAIIAGQIEAIAADLTALADSKDARGLPLFDGTAASIPIADGIAVAGNEDRDRVFGTIVAALTDYAAALRDPATGDAVHADAISTFKDAITHVSQVQGAVGARAARVELVAATAQDTAITTEAQRASIEDVDLPSAIADLQKTMTILSATQASFSKLTQLSLFDYLR